MTIRRRRFKILAAGCLGVAASAASAGTPAKLTGCNCRKGGGAGVGVGMNVMPPVSDPQMYGVAAGMGVAPAYAGVAGFGSFPTPPAGTLGQTYQRTMIPVPADKHPRAGLIDVRAPGANAVSVQWTNQFRLEEELSGFVDAKDSELWHFESPQIIPGVPNIYRVEARYGEGPSCTVQERYVRLVMGRIVHVSF
jgi:hypothetical protein